MTQSDNDSMQEVNEEILSMVTGGYIGVRPKTRAEMTPDERQRDAQRQRDEAYQDGRPGVRQVGLNAGRFVRATANGAKQVLKTASQWISPLPKG